MDLENILTAFETYSVNFVRYILSVSSPATFERRADDLKKRLFTFSLISALLGAFLSLKYVVGQNVGQNDLVTPVVTEFSIWVAFSVLVWVGVSVGRRGETRYTPALDAVLRVLPVTYVVGSYLGFLIANLAHLWTSAACAAWQAYAGIVVARFALIVVFMPISVGLAASAVSKRRARLVGGAVAVAMLAVQAGSLGAYLVGQADRRCTLEGTCTDPDAIHQYLVDELQMMGGCV